MQKLETEKRVLVDFTKRRTIQDLSAKLAEAKRALDRVKSQSRAKLVQADADRMAKDSIYKQELTRVEEIEAEIAKCLVLAPQDGLVVYYVSDQARSGGGSQQSIVAQGEPVREGQKMMQIPDLSQMVVNVRVHEAMVSNLRNEKDPHGQEHLASRANPHRCHSQPHLAMGTSKRSIPSPASKTGLPRT